MTIASATTTTELAWQEVDVVSFTAGTLSDINALKYEVERKLQRGTLNDTSSPTIDEVQNWIIRAIEETAEAYNFNYTRRYAYATPDAGSYRFALPPDFGGGATYLRDTTNNNYVPLIDKRTMDLKWPDISERGSSKASCAAIKDRELWLSPPSDGARLELEYRSTGESRTTVITHIPEPMRFKVVDGALSEAWEYLHEFDKAQYYKQKHMGMIQQAKRADGKQKFAASGYMARHWLY
jgi:hypothetical protein